MCNYVAADTCLTCVCCCSVWKCTPPPTYEVEHQLVAIKKLNSFHSGRILPMCTMKALNVVITNLSGAGLTIFLTLLHYFYT